MQRHRLLVILMLFEALFIVNRVLAAPTVRWGLNPRPQRQAASYIFSDVGGLGSPGNLVTAAVGINDQGQVLCSARVRQTGQDHDSNGQRLGDNDLPQYGFLWQAGSVRALGVPSPLCLNSTGQIVFERTFEAFSLWDNGHTSDLSGLNGEYFNGMNVAGSIVGVWHSRACLWQADTATDPKTLNGRETDLGTLGGYISTAYAISARTQVVGMADTLDGVSHPFLWQDGRMAQLGNPARGGVARAINGRGQVVGAAYTASGEKHAALFSGSKVTDLGVLPGDTESTAFAINDAGQIVGESFHWESGNIISHAVLWEHGRARDLDCLPGKPNGWTLWRALGINRRGQIVGNAYVGHQARVFLWTPKA